ncbi:hypothetical protein M7I_5612 [Glarea lozoyensis 74030]|uniref:Uncharacterized protein n=1 Tax=Glarea lozoyensis (strain ATCC 74030 / MF5533) TaxID=1104152 RepID=H0ESD3_GLAL7|nr:hypothetical protein M7I_5612 [Glarea lozoyensis 74030]
MADSLDDLWDIFQDQGSHWVLKSPELSIAWVKFSGSQAYVVSLQACGSDEDLRKWGLAIVDCLTDEKMGSSSRETTDRRA